MEAGLSTLEDECAMQGLDWEEVLEQRAREKAKMQELGLGDLTPSIAVKSLPGQGKNNTDNQEDDNASMEQSD